MFGSIGITELLIIFVVALVVIGPKRMPDLARTLGKTLRDFKRATSDFQDSVNLESDFDLDATSTSNDASNEDAVEEEKDPNRIDPSSPPEPSPVTTNSAETTSAASSSESPAPTSGGEEGTASSGGSSSPSAGGSDDEPPKERTEQT